LLVFWITWCVWRRRLCNQANLFHRHYLRFFAIVKCLLRL